MVFAKTLNETEFCFIIGNDFKTSEVYNLYSGNFIIALLKRGL